MAIQWLMIYGNLSFVCFCLRLPKMLVMFRYSNQNENGAGNEQYLQ